jgi:hypothetical protein
LNCGLKALNPALTLDYGYEDGQFSLSAHFVTIGPDFSSQNLGWSYNSVQNSDDVVKFIL